MCTAFLTNHWIKFIQPDNKTYTTLLYKHQWNKRKSFPRKNHIVVFLKATKASNSISQSSTVTYALSIPNTILRLTRDHGFPRYESPGCLYKCTTLHISSHVKITCYFNFTCKDIDFETFLTSLPCFNAEWAKVNRYLVETSSDLSRQSSHIFGRFRKMFEQVCFMWSPILGRFPALKTLEITFGH